jgi:hypothetical protein
MIVQYRRIFNVLGISDATTSPVDFLLNIFLDSEG